MAAFRSQNGYRNESYKKLSLWGTGITLLTILFSQAYADTNTHQDNSNQGFAFSTPVFLFNTEYSDQYQAYAQTQFLNTVSPDDAIAFLLGFGVDQFRIGLNWAHNLTANQRLKLGIEHFGQDNTFQYVTGNNHEFTGQNAIGGTYQYLFPQSQLQDIEVSAYYAHANNPDFPQLPFDVNSENFIDNRDVTGASLAGVSAGPAFQLWRGAQLSTAVNYDTLRFPARYEAAKNTAGVGGTLTFDQILTPRFSINLSASDRKTYQMYQANADWLAYQSNSSILNLGIYGSRLDSDALLFSHENIIGVNLAYQWGANARAVQNTTTQDLLNWSESSVAHLPAVFVMRDESVTPQ